MSGMKAIALDNIRLPHPLGGVSMTAPRKPNTIIHFDDDFEDPRRLASVKFPRSDPLFLSISDVLVRAEYLRRHRFLRQGQARLAPALRVLLPRNACSRHRSAGLEPDLAQGLRALLPKLGGLDLRAPRPGRARGPAEVGDFMRPCRSAASGGKPQGMTSLSGRCVYQPEARASLEVGWRSQAARVGSEPRGRRFESGLSKREAGCCS